ncbi:MAG: Asp-tRNA(Asn)/Glu-tRNA(Gln) amidotransferase subunit GatC [bacterium]|nr:Asp-tRNA(Asn)/Glu-tRNA(Gln) amidotransferase subunit GatC [bacterium]
MPLEKDEIKRIAALARLQLSENDLEKLSHDLTVVVDYFEQMTEVDTTGVEPRGQSVGTSGELREDVVKPSLSQKEALANAPESDGDFFLVPKVMG